MDVSNLLEQLVVSHDDSYEGIHSSPEPPLPVEHESTSIHSLPVELLEIIFTMTHRAWLLSTIHPQLLTINPTLPRNSIWDTLMRQFSLFPHVPASVCRLWREIITSTPHFWTRPVILVDSPASLTAQLTLFLKRSRQLPIVVAIVRRSYDGGYDPNERWRVAAVMNVLARNLHHFQDIYFHVTQSSSLPPMSTFFQSTAPHLVSIAMHCDMDDGVNVCVPPIPSRPDLPSPPLFSLKLDGRNFVTMCRNPSVWIGKFSFLKSLTIERLAFIGDELISLECAFIAIACLPLLSSLVLRDVTFLLTSPATRIPGAQRLKLGVSEVHLEDLEDDVIKGIHSIAHLSPTHLMLKNVSINEFPEVPCTTFLELADLRDDQDLEDFLTFWDGEVLSLRGCPSFDDNLLGLFEAEIVPPYHIAPSLRALHIEDCENFTGKALRRMVERRRDFAMREENRGLGFVCIEDVYVCGVGPTVLEEEDERWLRGNVRNFHWGLEEGNDVPRITMVYDD